jgi:hypothetical protein
VRQDFVKSGKVLHCVVTSNRVHPLLAEALRAMAAASSGGGEGW